MKSLLKNVLRGNYSDMLLPFVDMIIPGPEPQKEAPTSPLAGGGDNAGYAVYDELLELLNGASAEDIESYFHMYSPDERTAAFEAVKDTVDSSGLSTNLTTTITTLASAITEGDESVAGVLGTVPLGEMLHAQG